MSDASKHHTWSKPAAMAIPEGGFTKTKLNKAGMAPSFHRPRRATASRLSRSRSPVESRRSMSTVERSRKQSRRNPDCLAVLKLHYLRWLIFR